MPDKIIRAVIIEDDELSITLLTTYLEEYVKNVEVVGVAMDFNSAYELIASSAPDLIFLDIELKGRNSFDLLKKFQRPSFKVIVTTGHEMYAVTAFKFNVTGYLLKPFGPDEIAEVVAKVSQSMASNHPSAEHLSVSGSDGTDIIPYDHLIRIEADGMYSRIYIMGKNTKTYARPLGSLEQHLPQNIFVRIHHSHLINIHFIQKVHKDGNGVIELKDGSKLPISKRKKKEVLSRIKE